MQISPFAALRAARPARRPDPLALTRRHEAAPDRPATAPGGWLLAALAAELRVMTPAGPRAAGRLAPGDAVLTLDDGASRVLWTGRRRVTAAEAAARPALAPLLMPAGWLSPAAPRQDLRLSPRAGVLLERPDLPPGGLLVPAGTLAGRGGLCPAPGGDVTYVQIVLERHGLIGVEGVLVETLHPDCLPRAAPERAALAAALPSGTLEAGLYGPQVRPRAEAAPGRGAAGWGAADWSAADGGSPGGGSSGGGSLGGRAG
jgi:hypothetical protein